MASNSLIIALAKVLIAAAWSDGDLSNEEVNVMKDLLFRLPRRDESNTLRFTATEWAEVELYLQAPIEAAERARLVDELRATLNTNQEKILVEQMLNDLVRADGAISAAEAVVLQEVQSVLDAVDGGLIGQLSRLLSGPRQRRSRALADAPNREQYLDDFINNKVYYGVRRRLDIGEGVQLSIGTEQARQLCAFGGLLARVAHVDLQVTEEEFEAIVDALEALWGISREEALFVSEVAVSEIGPELDTLRLMREIATTLQPDQVDSFLDLLFAVAAADGFVSEEEINAIYEITRSFGLAHKRFIDAKLRVPSEKRAS